MREVPPFPWDQLQPYRDLASRHPDNVIDLSIGSPVDSTPESSQHALSQAADAHAYPATIGTNELRTAILKWLRRRRNVTVTHDEILPTVGSKEFIALLPFVLGLGAGDTVVFPEVAYPSYEMGAILVGATPLAADDPARWPESTRLVWINSPANPHGRVLGVDELRRAVARARELGAVLVSDECYAEFGWEQPWKTRGVPSVLDERVIGENHQGVLMAYSLSKQSNMAGYRAAYVAGDPELIASITTIRKHAGMMVPAPIQAAMIAALNDDEIVAAQTSRYAHRREILLPALEAAGFRVDHSEAGLYLWVTRGEDAWESIAWFARNGIVVGPGPFYGAAGAQHVRISLTAGDDTIREVAARLSKASSEA